MLKIYISAPDFNFGGPQILIVEQRPDGTRYVAKPVTLIMEPMPKGKSVDATFDFGSWERNEEFLQAMSDAIASRQTPTKNDHTVSGMLSATERHLEDLQILLNLKPKRT